MFTQYTDGWPTADVCVSNGCHLPEYIRRIIDGRTPRTDEGDMEDVKAILSTLQPDQHQNTL